MSLVKKIIQCEFLLTWWVHLVISKDSHCGIFPTNINGSLFPIALALWILLWHLDVVEVLRESTLVLMLVFFLLYPTTS